MTFLVSRDRGFGERLDQGADVAASGCGIDPHLGDLRTSLEKERRQLDLDAEWAT